MKLSVLITTKKENEMSKVKIIGRLGNDPETITSQKSVFTVLNIAENRDVYSKESQSWEKKDPYWFSILCFGDLSEKASDLKKGENIEIDAYLKPIKRKLGEKTYTFINVVAKKLSAPTKKVALPANNNLPDFYSDEEIDFETAKQENQQ